MKLLALLAVLVLVACTDGGNVDTGAPSFVDTKEQSTVDTGIIVDAPSEDKGVVNQSSGEFVPPPTNYTENATISIDEKKQWIGRDMVQIYVWNERGTQKLIMAEGTGVSVPSLKVNVEVSIIGPEDGGEVIFLVNGQKSKVLNMREEQKVGNTWIYVSDIFLSSPQ
jgi:hypothetical protein